MIETLTILAAIAGILSLLYVVFIGQEPLFVWLQRQKENKQKLSKSSDSESPIKHNLPSRDYREFIGRESEKTEILKRLQPYPLSNYHLVTIDGIGGIGKSALALETAYAFVENPEPIQISHRFNAIVWISAKETILTSSGIVKRESTFNTLQDIYVAISIVLERNDIIRAPVNQQQELVRDALARQRTLLIIDNLETVDDETVYAFLQELPAPTKAIITSRQKIDVAFPIHLRGMAWKDGQLFIANEFRKRGIKIEREPIRKLFDRTGGIPLAILWCIAQIASGHNIDIVLARLKDSNNDVVRFMFDELVKIIGNRQPYFVLMAISLFIGEVSDSALSHVMGFSSADLSVMNDALMELEKFSIITRQSGRTHCLPLTKSFAFSLIEKTPEFHAQIKNRLIDYYCSFTQDKTSNITEKTFTELEREYSNIIQAIHLSHQSRNWQAIATIVTNIDYFLEIHGYWNQRFALANLVVDSGNVLNDYKIIGAGNLAMSSSAYLMGNYSDAFKFVELSIQSFSKVSDSQGRILSLRQRGRIYARQGKLNEASGDYSKALELCDGEQTKKIATWLEHDLGRIARRREDFSLSRQHFLAFLKLSKDNNDIEGIATAYGNLGWLALQSENMAEAETYYQSSLDINKSIGRLLGLSYASLGLSRIEAYKGNRQKALIMANDALSICNRIGAKEQQNTIKSYINRLNDNNAKSVWRIASHEVWD